MCACDQNILNGIGQDKNRSNWDYSVLKMLRLMSPKNFIHRLNRSLDQRINKISFKSEYKLISFERYSKLDLKCRWAPPAAAHDNNNNNNTTKKLSRNWFLIRHLSSNAHARFNISQQQTNRNKWSINAVARSKVILFRLENCYLSSTKRKRNCRRSDEECSFRWRDKRIDRNDSMAHAPQTLPFSNEK